jgi:hypothetical protein
MELTQTQDDSRRENEAAHGAKTPGVSLLQLKSGCGALMSCVSVMMRMRNRTQNGAVGEGRLETGLHHGERLTRISTGASTHTLVTRNAPQAV